MAPTKKATGAAEAAETAQANISPDAEEKAGNGADMSTTGAEKEPEATYTADEFAKAAAKVFSKAYSPDIVRAAFAMAGKKEATKAEAKKIVEEFAKKEVKHE